MTKGMGLPEGFQAEPLNARECKLLGHTLRQAYAAGCEGSEATAEDKAAVRKTYNSVLRKLGCAEIEETTR